MFYLSLVMIQQLITVVTFTGFFISYSLRKLYIKNTKPKCEYEEIEITEYEYINLWDDV